MIKFYKQFPLVSISYVAGLILICITLFFIIDGEKRKYWPVTMGEITNLPTKSLGTTTSAARVKDYSLATVNIKGIAYRYTVLDKEYSGLGSPDSFTDLSINGEINIYYDPNNHNVSTLVTGMDKTLVFLLGLSSFLFISVGFYWHRYLVRTF